jgi:hypothetical protein
MPCGGWPRTGRRPPPRKLRPGALPRHIYLVRTLGLLAAGFAMMAIAGLLAFIAWWLRTWRNERLRPALVVLARHVPWFAMMVAVTNVSANLEHHFKWPYLLTFATTMAVMYAIGIPWWRRAYPAIESALLRASQSALRAGVGIAIAVTVLASGAWAFVYR